MTHSTLNWGWKDCILWAIEYHFRTSNYYKIAQPYSSSQTENKTPKQGSGRHSRHFPSNLKCRVLSSKQSLIIKEWTKHQFRCTYDWVSALDDPLHPLYLNDLQAHTLLEPITNSSSGRGLAFLFWVWTTLDLFLCCQRFLHASIDVDIPRFSTGTRKVPIPSPWWR
jgi:hypothetical protein